MDLVFLMAPLTDCFLWTDTGFEPRLLSGIMRRGRCVIDLTICSLRYFSTWGFSSVEFFFESVWKNSIIKLTVWESFLLAAQKAQVCNAGRIQKFTQISKCNPFTKSQLRKYTRNTTIQIPCSIYVSTFQLLDCAQHSSWNFSLVYN